MSAELSSGQIARALDIPVRSLENWVTQGLVIPDVHRASRQKGGGSSHRYSFANLVEFGLVQQLRSIGISIETIQSLLNVARQSNREARWFGELALGQQWVIIRSRNRWNVITGDFLPLPQDDMVLIVINLALLKQNLHDAISLFFKDSIGAMPNVA